MAKAAAPEPAVFIPQVASVRDFVGEVPESVPVIVAVAVTEPEPAPPATKKEN